MPYRVEKAGQESLASKNEMLEVSRRCAREIAMLRAKLAEKDAQLMGGFGSVANMVLGEMPKPGCGGGAKLDPGLKTLA